MSKHIVCVGKSTLDQIWPVGDMPTSGGKFRAAGYLVLGGGMAATAAVAVARLGGEASFCGRAGNDGAGHMMQQELADYGVDVSQFKLFDGARSSVSAIIVDRNGERMIVNYPGGDIPDSADWLRDDTLNGVSAVLGDVRWMEGAARLYQEARKRNLPTVMDGEAASATIFSTLLPLVDHAIFSLPGLRSFSGGRIVDHAESLQAVRLRGCKVASVTLGAQGVLWLDDEGLHHLRAFDTPVVDTTGAGDVFHGAYTLAIAEGMRVAEAMRFSSAVAALKCSHHGGRAGIPTREEVNQFLEQQK
ncbi:MAG: sugar kinase [Oxalobacter sp.]|nr:MAG: sugar kinase [Oxalobacter sp.]